MCDGACLEWIGFSCCCFQLNDTTSGELKLFTALRKGNVTNYGYAPEFVSRLFCSGIKSKIKQKNLRVPGGSKTSNCLEFTTQGCRITSDCKTNENHIK